MSVEVVATIEDYWRWVDPLRDPLPRITNVLFDKRAFATGSYTTDAAANHVVPRSDVVLGVAFSTLAFWVMRQVVCNVLVLVSRDYARLAAQRRHRFDLYVLSLVNAIWVGVLSLDDVLSALSGSESQGPSAWGLLVAMFGYLLHDFWATRHEWARYPADAVHHIAGFAISFGILASQDSVAYHYITDYGLVELSTIFLNCMFFLREFKLTETRAFHVLKYLFALSFFVTRPCYMCYNTVTLIVYDKMHERSTMLFLAVVGLVIASALQWYWFYAIVNNMILGRKKNKGGKQKSKKKQA